MAVYQPRLRRVDAGLQRTGFDTGLLTVLIVLLVGIPSTLIFAPLGAAGSPAQLMGLVMILIWAFRRISSFQFGSPANRIHVILLLFLGSALASYLAATTRPIAKLELNAADRWILSTLAWIGIALFTMDGVVSVDRLHTVLRRLTIAGACEAAVGIAQRFTDMALVTFIQIPGLTPNADFAGTISDRNNQARPSGTTIEPIEFGAVLTMILPIALYYAINDHHRSKLRRWLPVLLIAFAIPISISRTAVISTVVLLAIMLPTWPASLRRRAYLGIGAVLACVYVAVPGLLGTISYMFTSISSDSSAASRTGSYDLVFSMISRSPIFGRGMGTFLPAYRILDNQLLLTTVGGGLVGLAALLGLLVVPVLTCFRVRRTSTDEQVRQLTVALAAGIAAAGCSFAFYDALAFPMATSLMFLLIGAAGFLWRYSRSTAATLRVG